MKIKKRCKRLDFKTGKLEIWYTIDIPSDTDIDNFIQRLWGILRVPPRYLGRR
jgi:hypothetical protein